MESLWAFVTLVLSAQMCVRMSDQGGRSIVQFVADIARHRWVVAFMMVVEVMDGVKVFVAI